MLSYMLIIVLTSIVIGVASISASSSYMRRKIVEMSNQLIYQVLMNIEYRSSEFEKVAFHAISDPSFLDVARNQREDRSKSKMVIDASLMGTVLNEITLSLPEIQNIYISLSNGTVFSWEKGNPKLDINALTQKQESLLDSVIEMNKQESTGILWYRQDDDVLFIKKIIDPEMLSTLGYAVFVLDPDFFRLSLPYKSSFIDPENIIVLNRDHSVILSAQNPLVTQLVDYMFGDEIDEEIYADNETIDYGREEYLLTRLSTPDLKWSVMNFTPLWNAVKEVKLISYTIISIIFIYIVFASFLAWLFSGSTTHTIHLLYESMDKVEEGDFSIRIKPVSYDEVGQLALRFNDMVKRIDALIHDVSNERLIRQAKEFQLLQTQVNPHFLYNTLESVKSIAHFNNQHDIERMITYLVDIMKTSLSLNKKYCRFHEELLYVDNYIRLQKIRYENRFSVQYEIDESTEDLYIVSFILQPIIENALFHGLELNRAGGAITISSSIEGNVLLIRIEDNGIGMSENMIEMIHSNLADESEVEIVKSEERRFNHNIGLKNVDERIRYCFGREFGLSFQSIPGEGTTVTIRLPLLSKEPE